MPTTLLLAALLAATDDIDAVNLEDLLDFETDVASTTALSLRESPGIITVITRDEILRAGARDLVDVLNLVPGVAFGLDVEGVAGIGFRGLWGHEGKVLLMVDGLQMNELLYGTLQFGNHIPVEHIERIEIIRGPGSVVYGGFAELAVINVVTRSVDTLHNGAVAGAYGRMRDTTGRWMGHAGYGGRIGELEVTAQASIGHAIRSDRIFVDDNGGRVDLQNASDLNPGFVDVGVRYRGLAVRFIYDDYRTTQQTDYGEVQEASGDVRFRTIRTEVRYEWQLADHLTLTPKLSYTWQRPWSVTDRSTDAYYDKTAQRLSPALTLTYQPIDAFSVAFGAQMNLDHAALVSHDSTLLDSQGFATGRTVQYENYIGFAEALWRTEIVNVEAGARVEHHSIFGGSFVPRLALTHVFGDLHVKGLASRAFRAPTFENITSNADIAPERTNAFELEAGYRFGEHVFASVNVFDITIYHPIVYTTGANLSDIYLNADRAGSRGVESVVRFVKNGSYATLGYSFYTTSGHARPDVYRVAERDHVLLAFPAHKLTLNTSFKIVGKLSVGGTVMLVSRRYASDESFAPTAYLSATVYYSDLLVSGLDLSASLHNAGDAQNPLIQPYDGGHRPLPSTGREAVVRLAYAF